MKTKRSTKKILVSLLALIVICGVAFGGYQVLKPKPTKQTAPQAKITKLAPSTSTGEKTSSTQNGINKGSAKDTTQPAITSSPNKWTSSQAGDIVVQAPLAKSVLSSGFVLSGTSSLSSLQYRLIDEEVGVVSQGPLQVKDGKFAASVSFQKRSASGRLDVFTTDPSGKETSEVQLQVSFE